MGTLALPFDRELVVDLFAGGGGASLGLARAYRAPDVAINHDPVAIAVHTANHPGTAHYQADVFEVDPVTATGGRPVAVLWASPDCRHHSKAAGGRPRSKKVRALAWVVVKWAKACRPRVILLENVEEFAHWGPLDREGRPCRRRRGQTFQRWVSELRRLGYAVEWRELRAADYGAPTIRKRLYLIARCDGRPIVWPSPTHCRTGRKRPRWRAAAECIDWSLPARSIFDRPRPLADNTHRRIARGLWRYVLDCAEPFVVPAREHQDEDREAGRGKDEATGPADQGTGAGGVGSHGARHPAGAVGAEIRNRAPGAPAAVTPFLTEHANASTLRVFAADDPLRTQVANIKGGHFALVSAYLDQANGGFYDGAGRDVREPVSTVMTSGANQRLVTAYLIKYYGNEREGSRLAESMHTVTTRDRLGLVQAVQVPRSLLTESQWAAARRCAEFCHRWLPEHFPGPADAVLVHGLVLVDITLRMLAPREGARGQGFPDSYHLERGLFVNPATGAREWRPITKTDQVRLVGNSVCPDVAAALAAANLTDLITLYTRHAA